MSMLDRFLDCIIYEINTYGKCTSRPLLKNVKICGTKLSDITVKSWSHHASKSSHA